MAWMPAHGWPAPTGHGSRLQVYSQAGGSHSPRNPPITVGRASPVLHPQPAAVTTFTRFVDYPPVSPLLSVIASRLCPRLRDCSRGSPAHRNRRATPKRYAVHSGMRSRGLSSKLFTGLPCESRDVPPVLVVGAGGVYERK
ncbi:hypothetical protein BBSC_1367 [Bifidobacterium scardovii JCM 12489 = DSM 13734]|nr:hypothetical protein BBSC_1367 [Bifidobacterium scardovii JCM 12489 = DSM 13734]